jgi:aminomuconate-semialdehyde/2-hydroxymuconate-6-semialdehyde dehydrogenase
MAARIEVGITWINSWFLRDLRTAFGGSKQSGIGREGGCIRWSSTPSCATSA